MPAADVAIDPFSRLGIPAQTLAEFNRKWRIAKLELIGSILREDFRSDSDVDFLITFEADADWTLLDYVEMEDEMAQLSGRRVDMIERDALESSANYLRRRHTLEHPAEAPQLDDHLLLDILLSARQAISFVHGVDRADVNQNDMLQDAF